MCMLSPVGGSYSFKTHESTRIFEKMPCVECVLSLLRSGVTRIVLRLPNRCCEIRFSSSVPQYSCAAEPSKRC